MNTEKQIVRVVVPPCSVDGVPRRLVEFDDGSGAVQSWRQGRWEPGGCSVKDVLMGSHTYDPETGVMSHD
jgi:hypothetical protein